MGTVNKTLTLGNTVSSTLNVNSVRGTNSGWSTPHYTFTLSVKLNSQSTTNNTSNVDITLFAVAKNDYWNGTAITYTVYKSDSDSYSTSSSSNYKSQSFSGFSYSEYSSGTSKTVVSWTNVTINHNTDGSKIVYVNASGPGNGGNSDAPNRFNFSTGGSSAAMKITLPTIARASTVSSPTTYSVTSTSSSSGLNITVEPKASYYHTIIWKIGSTTIKSDNRTSKTSSNFTATIYNSELLNKISSSSANVVAEVSTYSTYSNNVYSGQIGSTVITPAIGVTVDTSMVKPSITSITTGGKTTISGSSIYIAGVSKPVISWDGTNKIGAGTYSYTISIVPSVSGLTPLTATRSNLTSGSSHTFTNTLPTYSSNYNATVSLTVTDSRGGFDTLETTISVYGYQQPNISQFDAYRVVDATHDTRDPAGTIVRVKYTVSYSTITVSNANKNTLSVICNKNGSQLSNTSTYNSTFTLNAGASCTITLAVNDSITTLPTRTIIISQAAYPLDLYDNSSGSVGVGLGTTAESGFVKIGNGLYTKGNWLTTRTTVSDLNQITEGSVYWGTSVSNRPGNYGVNYTLGYDGTSNSSKWYTQVAFSTDGKNYWRNNINNGGWSTWKQIFDSSNASDIVTAIKSSILSAVYPVGSIYMSVNSTSPATLFGGTWVQLKDRFLLGAGDTYANGGTGGESTHTLTVDEIPSHKHNLQYHLKQSLYGGSPDALHVYGNGGTAATVNGNFINNTGGGQAHNNMPPYLVVYMWKRTA